MKGEKRNRKRKVINSLERMLQLSFGKVYKWQNILLRNIIQKYRTCSLKNTTFPARNLYPSNANLKDQPTTTKTQP